MGNTKAYAANALSLDGKYVSGSMTTYPQTNSYPITLTSSGTLKVTVTATTLTNGDLGVVDEDGKTMSSGSWNGASESNPQTSNITVILKPGNYNINITDRCDGGAYKVKASFASYNTNEKEPNDSYLEATSIKLGQQTRAALTANDSVDFFKFTLSKKTTVRINQYTTFDCLEMFLYNGDLEQISTTLLHGTSTSLATDCTLNAGTYYIKMGRRMGRDQGLYTLKVAQKYLVTKITLSNNKVVTPGSSFTLKAAITPSNATDKTLTWTSSNTSVASVDSSTGKVTANKIGKTTITATAQDGSKVKKSVTVYVKPKKGSFSRLSRSGSHKIFVCANTQYGANGYQVQYSTSSKFKKAKTLKMSNGSRTIKNLKNGRKYYVRVRAYYKASSKVIKYGKWSKTKSITPKK